MSTEGIREKIIFNSQAPSINIYRGKFVNSAFKSAHTRILIESDPDRIDRLAKKMDQINL